jgi:hypothetical protein
VKQGVILKHELAGAKVPPEIRVIHTASRHGEQAESENENEHPASLQQSDHEVSQGKGGL